MALMITQTSISSFAFILILEQHFASLQRAKREKSALTKLTWPPHFRIKYIYLNKLQNRIACALVDLFQRANFIKKRTNEQTNEVVKAGAAAAEAAPMFFPLIVYQWWKNSLTQLVSHIRVFLLPNPPI